MVDLLPDPPVPADADLRDFPFMPIDIGRLFNSAFHARANDPEWRAGVTLWLKSYHQVPAGSLPEDDVELCRLAELGRDMRTWRKIKAMALYGWSKHADGRLYHATVTEKAAEAWRRKEAQRERSRKGNAKRWGERGGSPQDDPGRVDEDQQGERKQPPGIPGGSPSGTPASIQKVIPQGSRDDPKGQGQREGQRQREREEEEARPAPPNGAHAPPPAADDPGPIPEFLKRQPDEVKAAIFGAGLSWLMKNTGSNEASCRSFLGSLIGQHGEIATATALLGAERAKPVDPRSWLKRNIGATNGQQHPRNDQEHGLSPELAGISAALARRSVQPGG